MGLEHRSSQRAQGSGISPDRPLRDAGPGGTTRTSPPTSHPGSHGLGAGALLSADLLGQHHDVAELPEPLVQLGLSPVQQL